MRDLTKSISSFSWAMSLFGLEQMMNLARPAKAAAAFEAVTEATERQLGDLMKSTFRAGDNMQRAMVDMTMGFMSMDAIDPGRWTRAAGDMLGRTTEAVGQAAGQAGAAARRAGEEVRRAGAA
jgi:hypothetical protein